MVRVPKGTGIERYGKAETAISAGMDTMS